MDNLCIREEYTDKQGNKKVNWNRIGTLFEANGKKYVKLFHIPGVQIFVFAPKPKDDQPPQHGYREGEVDLGDEG